MLVQADGYLVVIGRYSTEAEALRGLDELRRQKLKTEVYIPKVLKLFREGSATYYVTYSGPLPKRRGHETVSPDSNQRSATIASHGAAKNR